MSQPASPYAPPAQAGPEPRPGARQRPRPSPLVALLLSLVLTQGLGHIYAARPRRALAWAAVPLASLPVFALLAHTSMVVSGILLVGLAYLVNWVAMLVDAWSTAAASKERAPLWHLPLYWLGVTVTVVVLAMGTRRFVIEAYKIPSGSMIPTLLVGDHVFVDKAATAKRGDVVVFPFPEHPEQDFVKRVIGLPGDRLEFHEGHPTVNGAPLPSCRVGDYTYSEGEMGTHTGDIFLEVAGERAYLAFYERGAGIGGEQGPFTVAPGEMFVVGDNRDNAHDSRFWYGGRGGGVPIASVRGVPLLIWMSVSDEGVDESRAGLPLDEPHLPRSAASLAPALAECLKVVGHPRAS